MEKPVKKFAYRVTYSTHPGVKVGQILVYKRSKGKIANEIVMDWNTGKETGEFGGYKIGPVWLVNGKLQFEKPPAKRNDRDRPE